MDIQTKSDITVELIQHMGDDAMLAASARVSTSGIIHIKDHTADAGLLNYLMKHRHGTPFEHGSMTFFVHAPIFVWREWHRHRIGFSYNEESARYKQLEPVFWIPHTDRKVVPTPEHTSARPQFVAGTPEDYNGICALLTDSYHRAYANYQTLLNRGYAKEVARACLPVAIYSACWVTCNPRSLMAFLSLRTHDSSALFVSYPQAEIQQAARAMEDLFAQHWPLTYQAFCDNGRVAP